MSENELKELLTLPEYSWVKEDLLPTYYVLSKMGFGIGNGYQFLPTSEENLLINLMTKRALSELREFEQIFAGWIDRERVPAVYQPSPRSNVYTHGHHSVDAHEIRINITGPLLNIGKEQFKMIKMDLGFDFEIKTIYDLFFFKYLLSNVNVKALEDTGLLSIITKDEMWESWSESAAHSAKSLVRKLISCNKAFLSDAVIGTMASKLMGDREIFYEFMDSIPERYKVVEHDFNSSSCYLHYKYAIPSEVWSGIKAKIEGIDYESIIKPSLSKLEEEYGEILNEIKFLELLKQEKVDANNRMKIGDYERFSDVIERLNREGIIKIASTGDIILLVEGETVVTRINSLMEQINDMILRWLNKKVEPERGIEPVKHPVQPPPRAVTEEGEEPVEKIKATEEVRDKEKIIVSKDTIFLGTDKPSLQYGVIGKISGKKVLIDLNEPHTISIFGVQRMGKSYTLGVITEMAVKAVQNISTLAKPLASVIFHYSKKETYIPEFESFIRPNRNQEDIRGLKELYEAEPMAIQNIKIIVPPGKLVVRKKEYEGLEVEPLLFRPQELGAPEWRLLLGAGGEQLYLKKIKNILEKLKNEDRLTVEHLKTEILTSELNKNQKDLSILRVRFVEKFLDENAKPFEEYLLPGSVILLDIRDEMLDEQEASILLGMLLISMGRIDEDKLLVIDEAHKYFGKALEKDIVELIREMAHTRTRILIASQDPPSVNARVIELSDIIILHQMSSPEWLKHIQGKNIALKKLKSEDLSLLKSGEAYIWAKKSTAAEVTKQPMKIEVRPRITEHGGATKTAV
ncbi:MAG: hypothetical protein WBD09_08205 [Halobacteriota archaeon]